MSGAGEPIDRDRRGPPLVVVPRPLDHPDAVALVEQIQQYYVAVYGGRDDDATPAAEFAPPRGLFLVGYLDAVAVASGGWRRHPDGSAEIKRMFVADRVRGVGVGRRLLLELERAAWRAGARRVVLNTGYRQQVAIRFYEAAGYARSERRFGFYAGTRGAHFYAKELR